MLQQLGAPRDSAAPKIDLNSKATRDSLERAAKDLFKNLFGKPKPQSPPPSAPPPQAPDTSKH